MGKSDSIAALAAALSKAQKALKAANKDASNPFFKSSYADLPSVVEACRDALADNGLSYSQVPDFEGDNIWLETFLMHSSGEWISGRYPIRPVKNDPQGVGSAFTYGRRYALMAMVGIVADDGTDDDGNAASGHATPSRGPVAVPSQSTQVTAAGKWAKEAAALIATLSEPDLEAWEKKNALTLVSLRSKDEAAHKSVVAAIRERHAALAA